MLPTSAEMFLQQDLKECVPQGALFHQLLIPCFTARQARQEHPTQSSLSASAHRGTEPHRPPWPSAAACTFSQVPRSPWPPLAGFPSPSSFLQVLVNALCLHFNNFLEPNPTRHKSALKPGIHSGPQSLFLTMTGRNGSPPKFSPAEKTNTVCFSS